MMPLGAVMRNVSFLSGPVGKPLVRIGGSSGLMLVTAALMTSILGSNAMASGQHSAPPQCIPSSASTIVPAQYFPTQLAAYTPPITTTVTAPVTFTPPPHHPLHLYTPPGSPPVYSSGGGSVMSGGGGASSGGAPSPEVNAILYLALAGGTVAFLRRRGRDRATSEA